ncbi:MAG: LemA family protein [Ilumatobacteraceae bacterium]|jgi:LemA protein|nr:LemA family protein [Ilumatobacteraceae bacterium]
MALTSLTSGMTKKRKQLIGGVAAVVVIFLAVISSYNGLVDKETRVDQASADLEVQLQRRFDLIPNLVSAVEGAMTQERTIFTALAEARSKYAGATSSNDKIAAASQVESALSRLLVVVENYPTLTSTQNVRDLQVQLEGTENRVAQARRDYNEFVTAFNRALRTFPRSIISGLSGFEKRALYVADPASQTAPKVDLTPSGS